MDSNGLAFLARASLVYWTPLYEYRSLYSSKVESKKIKPNVRYSRSDKNR